MTWTVGQEVFARPARLSPGRWERVIVTKVHKDGRCTTSDGHRWMARGRAHGRGDDWNKPWLLEVNDDTEKSALAANNEHASKPLRAEIDTTARRCADPAVLERALAVLRGEL